MASTRVDVDTRELEARVRELLRQFPEAGEECMQRACLHVEGKAKQNAPVDTGTLRSSITHKVVRSGDDTEGIIYTNEEYAPYVEFGTGIYAEEGGRTSPWKYKGSDGNWYITSGQKAKKFLSKAIVSEQDKIIEEFKRFLNNVD